ncbi:DenB-like DNA endonuclease IV [Acinetobacter phage vB_AbaM_PhT2-v2]
MKDNKTFVRLTNIPPRLMTISDLSAESREKVHDTVSYAMSQNSETDIKQVTERCIIAILAEQYVAEWLNGHVMHGEEDLEDPWTYAFDVLAGPEYYGMRIEVKTHQSASKYISVNTGHVGPFKGSTGINLRPFIEQPQADLIIIFDTERQPSGWLIKPYMLSDKDSLVYPGIIVKSKFEGYYINQYVNTVTKNKLNIFYF